MKTAKMITLDVELVVSLEKLKLNISQYCNEKLWDYVTKMEGVKKDPIATQDDIIKEIEALEKEQEKITHRSEIKEQMEAEGITDDKILFLRSMPINIMVAKDMKLGWKRKFNEEIAWAELLDLKRKWG